MRAIRSDSGLAVHKYSPETTGALNDSSSSCSGSSPSVVEPWDDPPPLPELPSLGPYTSAEDRTSPLEHAATISTPRPAHPRKLTLWLLLNDLSPRGVYPNLYAWWFPESRNA